MVLLFLLFCPLFVFFFQQPRRLLASNGQTVWLKIFHTRRQRRVVPAGDAFLLSLPRRWLLPAGC